MANFPWYHTHMETNLHPVLSVRLFTDEKCFGPGVATLLQLVQTCHSLRAAAMQMGMAYSKAWTIVKSAEEHLGFKLLSSTTGGRHGGGAQLTEQAAALLEAYTRYCQTLREFAQRQFAADFSAFL